MGVGGYRKERDIYGVRKRKINMDVHQRKGEGSGSEAKGGKKIKRDIG